MSTDSHTEAVQKAFDAEINAGPAPEEAIDLSGDGGVMKTILKEGSGWESPKKGVEVAVHYTGTLLSGEKFDSSVDRDQLFRFPLGKGRVIKGWDITVASMKRGEKCRVELKSDYAYGDQGSPPKIPPKATLVFEIELFEFNNEVDITTEKSGTITKLETKASSGFEKPEYDAEVKISYRVSTTEGAELVPTTEVSFVMGDETFPQGVQFAISTLEIGSAAKFTIHPVQAYGSAGDHAKRTDIPDDATTVWNIELLEVRNSPDPSDLSPSEKIALATTKKNEGNALFTQGKYSRALKKYDFAASFTKFVPGDDAKAAEELSTVCRLNSAQCLLKLKSYTEAEDRCTTVLKSEPRNIKALYRRALARHALQNLAEAANDLKLLLEADGSHQEAVRELARVNAKIKAQEDRDRALYSKMFQ